VELGRLQHVTGTVERPCTTDGTNSTRTSGCSAPRERAWRALENQRYVLMDHMPVPEFIGRNPDED